MPRAHFTKAVIRRVSGAPADGSVAVHENGTLTPIAQLLYTSDTGTATLPNPFTFAQGQIDFYLDKPQRVRVVVTPSGSAAQTFDDVDVDEPANLSARFLYDVMTPGVMTSGVERRSVLGLETGYPGTPVLLLPAVPVGRRRVIKSITAHNAGDSPIGYALTTATDSSLASDFNGGTIIQGYEVQSLDSSLVLLEGEELRCRYSAATAAVQANLGLQIAYVDIDPAATQVERIGRVGSIPADGASTVVGGASARDRIVAQVMVANRDTSPAYVSVLLGTENLCRSMRVPASSITVLNGPFRLAPNENLTVRNLVPLPGGAAANISASAFGYTRTLD